MTSGDLASKLSRAIWAYLLTQGVITPADNHAEPSQAENVLPVTRIEPGEGRDGVSEQFTPGYVTFENIELILHDKAAGQPDDPYFGKELAAINRFSGIWNAMNLSTDGTTLDYTAGQITAAGQALAVDPSNGTNAQQAQVAAANADMTDFTMVKLWAGGPITPAKAEDGTFWERGMRFSTICCNSALLN